MDLTKAPCPECGGEVVMTTPTVARCRQCGDQRPLKNPPDCCPVCGGENISYGGGSYAGCGTCGHYGDASSFEQPPTVDYAAKRTGTVHEETPRDGRSWCMTCGWVDELDPDGLAVRKWHGDSVGDEPAAVAADDAMATKYLENLVQLVESFEFELCGECGQDAHLHKFGPNALGLPHAYCMVAQKGWSVDLSSLTSDGDTVEVDESRTLRLRILPDADIDPFDDSDFWGKIAPLGASPRNDYGERERPTGFDGNAEKLSVASNGETVWWQPPADGPERTDPIFAKFRQNVLDLLENGMCGVVLEILDGKDAYGTPVVVKTESLWGIDSLENGYLAVVVKDLAQELGLTVE